MLKKIKKKTKQHELINFSFQNLSTGQVGEYILKELYKKNNFSHIGYKYVKDGGELRCILYTLSNPSKRLVNYFNDRCPAMVEEKANSYEGIAHEFVKWGSTGIEIVQEYKED